MDKFMNFKILTIVLFAIIFGNLLVVNVILFSSSSPTSENNGAITSSNNNEKETKHKTVSNDCNESCIEEIKNKVLLDLSANKEPNQKELTTTTSPIGPTNLQKEYFIALGNGSSKATEWELVPGAQAVIDGSAYVSVKQINFQASLHTPTGNQIAWARLYNITDDHPVWNSEVSISGGESKLLISDFISLENSPKTYQVQMKTQTGHTTNLIQSRIYIQTF